ncbi:MAG TPA: DedA family protein [Candidatus Norongarragalinales archaeon]|jgi:membrane protein DedA with SNARE-associated domain|nr:DedA family protein [Candidatus Norongarragalinales archaeon]
MVLELLSAFEQTTTLYVTTLMTQYGGLGVLVGMFLESSFVPIPSEFILAGAGALGIPILIVAVYGTIGSTLGGILGYAIGKYGGRPVVDKIGPYLLLTPEKVSRVEEKTKKYGFWGVLVARLIPFIPFKVFSIASGLVHLDFKSFVIATLIGTFPRALLLAYVGSEIVKYGNLFWTVIIGVIVAVIVLYFANKQFHFFGKPGAMEEKKTSRRK